MTTAIRTTPGIGRRRRHAAAFSCAWLLAAASLSLTAGETPGWRQMLSPFGVHQGSLFYASLGVPQLEAAWTLPAGATQWRFRSDHSHTDWIDADAAPFAAAGAAVLWLAAPSWSMGIQVQAATAAFGDVRFLDGPPFTAQVGARKAFPAGFLEFGGGAGLNEFPSDWQIFAAWIPDPKND